MVQLETTLSSIQREYITRSKMMKYYNILFVLFIVLSCGSDKDEGSYEIPNLKDNIKEFIEARKCFKKDTKVVRVYLQVKSDTLSVQLADIYPDVKKIKYNFDTVLYGNRIIFTGDRIRGYCKASEVNQYPADLIEISKSIEWPFIEEFTSWQFLYKDGKLIYKVLPCVEDK
ncbi:hypothetical protein A4R26_32570 [Niastella populi]|uniref:Uncharacterized protein n=2 Tax=Niastella populi TaxID=550983 RepID=A0A1V9GBA7_9BACT|nr:hypothetical protein A4R26_32570 [Niastella populi]